MPAAPIRADDDERIRVLRSLQILDTAPEERFDRLTRIANLATGCPTALVSLVDTARQWFKSRVGMDTCQTSRSLSFCAYVVHSREPLIIEDAAADLRTADLANVTGPPHIRAYAGFPLLTPTGHCLGSFCVISYEPRAFSPRDRAILRDLAAVAEAELNDLDKNQLIADLALANEVAEQATAAQGRLTAIVAHEIRNALNGIVGATELLDAGVPLTDLARILRTSSRSLMALIDDLLDFYKISEDRLQLQAIPVEIRAVALEVVEVIRLRVQRHVAVEWNCHDDVPAWVAGDPLRLNQILLNLLGNAAKFTHTGSIRLKIRGAAAPADAVEFEITDTGEGVDPEQAAKLFEPFQQAGADVAARHGGTGLGLAISRSLIEQMGGSIRFESEKGTGSTLTFVISAPAIPAPAPLAPSADASPTGKSLRILVAEDDRINQRLLDAMLRKLGHSATFVTTGQAAIDQAARPDTWDAILMDVGLVDMDGLTATRRIRDHEAQSASRPIPIIATTADATEASRAACTQAGTSEFLPKPITLAALQKSLDQLPSNHSPR